MCTQIINREIQIFVSHRSITSADLGGVGCEEKYYRKYDLTGEGVRLLL